MAENRREDAFGVGARQRELIGVADARGLDLNQHFAGPWAVQLDGGDFKRFSRFKSDGCANVHSHAPGSYRVCYVGRTCQSGGSGSSPILSIP